MLENYVLVQEALAGLKTEPQVVKQARNKFGGFFFALRVDPRVCYSSRELINPDLKIFGQELDLAKRLVKLYGRAAKIIPTAFVYHFKSVTVAISGYEVGKWEAKFDMLQSYHTGEGNILPRAPPSAASLKFGFAFSSKDASQAQLAESLGNALESSLRLPISYLDMEQSWYNVRDVDVLVVLSLNFNLSKLRAFKSTMIRVALFSLISFESLRSFRFLGNFDLVLVPSMPIKMALSRSFPSASCFIRCPADVEPQVQRRIPGVEFFLPAVVTHQNYSERKKDQCAYVIFADSNDLIISRFNPKGITYSGILVVDGLKVKLGSQIHLDGTSSNKNVIALCPSSQVLVFGSHDSQEFLQGRVLEAIASGAVVLISSSQNFTLPPRILMIP